MNGYINRLIQRYSEPIVAVRPRLTAKFEQIATVANFTGIEPNVQPVQQKQPNTTGASFVEFSTASLPPSDGFQPREYLRKEKTIEPINVQPVLQTGPTSQPEYVEPIITGLSQNISNNNKDGAGPVQQPIDLWNQSRLNPETFIIQPEIVKPVHKDNEKAEPIKAVTKEHSAAIPSYQSTISPRLKIVEIERPGEQAPVIRVTIGRIEVKAVTAVAPVKTTRKPIPGPRLSLDDYLKQKNNAG